MMNGQDCSPTTESPGGMEIRPAPAVTMAKKVRQRITDLQDQLAAAERMRELLDKNPDIEELLTLVPRLGLY